MFVFLFLVLHDGSRCMYVSLLFCVAMLHVFFVCVWAPDHFFSSCFRVAFAMLHFLLASFHDLSSCLGCSSCVCVFCSVLPVACVGHVACFAFRVWAAVHALSCVFVFALGAHFMICHVVCCMFVILYALSLHVLGSIACFVIVCFVCWVLSHPFLFLVCCVSGHDALFVMFVVACRGHMFAKPKNKHNRGILMMLHDDLIT